MLLGKQQNSFSILDLNYSPFPSAVSARTYNRELLREPPGPPGTHPLLRPPPLGRPCLGCPCLGRSPRRGGPASRRRQRAQRQDQRAEQCGALRSHGSDGGRRPGRQPGPPGSPTLSSRPPIPPEPGTALQGGSGAGLGPRGPGRGGDLAWIFETPGFPPGPTLRGAVAPSPQLRGGDQAQGVAYRRH